MFIVVISFTTILSPPVVCNVLLDLQCPRQGPKVRGLPHMAEQKGSRWKSSSWEWIVNSTLFVAHLQIAEGTGVKGFGRPSSYLSNGCAIGCGRCYPKLDKELRPSWYNMVERAFSGVDLVDMYRWLHKIGKRVSYIRKAIAEQSFPSFVIQCPRVHAPRAQEIQRTNISFRDLWFYCKRSG